MEDSRARQRADSSHRLQEAVTDLPRTSTHVIDQDLPPFVIAENGAPVGTINDGDSVIFYNFRGDRSIEISKALTTTLISISSTECRYPKVIYAGMLEYDGDLHIPKKLPRQPAGNHQHHGRISRRTPAFRSTRSPKRRNTVTSPTSGTATSPAKFNDRTGNLLSRSRPDVVPFEQRPWMKCAEITDTPHRSTAQRQVQVPARQLSRTATWSDTPGSSCGNPIAAMEALDLQLGRSVARD